jgi:hypothetical protein
VICGQKKNGDFAAPKILLVLQIAVGGEKKIEFLFSRFEKLSVFETTPALLLCGYKRVSAEESHQF